MQRSWAWALESQAWLFPDIVCRGNAEQKQVALTFDDGPARHNASTPGAVSKTPGCCQLFLCGREGGSSSRPAGKIVELATARAIIPIIILGGPIFCRGSGSSGESPWPDEPMLPPLQPAVSRQVGPSLLWGSATHALGRALLVDRLSCGLVRIRHSLA